MLRDTAEDGAIAIDSLLREPWEKNTRLTTNSAPRLPPLPRFRGRDRDVWEDVEEKPVLWLLGRHKTDFKTWNST